jgi:hypothetical protein
VAKTCRCGCEQTVKGLRRSKQFVDDSHRQRYRRRRAAEKEQRESQPASNLEVAGKEPAGRDPWADEDHWRPFPGDTSQW